MRKKYLAIVIIIFTLFAYRITGEKICNLNEVGKLEELVVNDSYAYLAEEFRIHIYSLKNQNYLTSFGKKGEGPREFPDRYNINLFNGGICIDSMIKILFYTRAGNYIKEIRKDPNCNFLIPVGENYVGFNVDFATENVDKVKEYYIYDRTFNRINKIGHDTYIGKLLKRIRSGEKYDDYIPRMKKNYLVYEQKVFIGDNQKGIHFEVFDKNGKFIRIIAGDYQRPDVSEEYKNQYMNELRKRKDWERIKQRRNIIFEKYFPCYERFLISNNHFFLITYLKERDRRKCLVVNMEGKVTKTILVKDIPLKFISIYGDHIYYVMENEELELWELHREKK